MSGAPFEILLVTAPGLEALLAAEAKELDFDVKGTLSGGVTVMGGWPDVWRANRNLRGASRVLARIGQFRAAHLSELDKRARRFPWEHVLRRDVSVTVEASCSRSKIYHSGAAAERIARAIREELGAPVAAEGDITIKARIDRDLVTLSVDTSGGLLHKRGSKQAMAKAPMRESIAALLLRACGYTGAETVLDPMCGSGTFLIEAAEIAAGLSPGRNRRFAFEKLATFNASPRPAAREMPAPQGLTEGTRFFGSDRDAGAITAAIANAERARVSAMTVFERKPVSEIAPPPGPPGLAICNPPYGTRIGEEAKLLNLYASFGRVLRERFVGWRVGLITSNERLARATGLPFEPKPLVFLHGGLRVKLFVAAP